MRMSDWSSDVCSSDLLAPAPHGTRSHGRVTIFGSGLSAASFHDHHGFSMTTDITRVRIDTTLGAIELELDAAKAPKTVANFVQYANEGHYDRLVFHRVIQVYMIQG